MFSIDPNRAAAELLQQRLRQVESKVRRRVIHRVQTAVTKEALAAVKGGRVPVAVGILRRSFRRKIKVYTATAVGFGIVGTDTKIKQVAKQYKDYRLGKMRTWIKGQPKKGPKYQAPSKYIHLAGKGRKNVFINDTLKSIRPKLDAIAAQVLRDEILKL